MLAFVGDGPSIFRNQVDQMMRTPDGVERWYPRAIDIIAKGNRVGTVSIEGLEWQEVDLPQDVEAADALTATLAEEGRYVESGLSQKVRVAPSDSATLTRFPRARCA